MIDKAYVVDHGVGNTVAIMNLLRRMGYSAEKVQSSQSLSGVDYAKSKFILPGVGSFDAGMKSLEERGLSKVLIEHGNRGGHILGICLGMQLLLESSEEGTALGLGLLPGKLAHMTSSNEYRVPHVGWEKIEVSSPDQIFTGINNFRFYHNHSFALPSPSPYELATIDHIERYTVAIRRENIVGVQFHPEKSHSEGQRIFSNFLGQ